MLLGSIKQFSEDGRSQKHFETKVKNSKLQDDVEAEMKRLKQELKQTMEMYSKACKEALSAKQKVRQIEFCWRNYISLFETLK